MKKFKQVICALALVPIFSGATLNSNDDTSQVAYFSGSLIEAQHWAKSQGKNSIAFFTAKWCAPCKAMQEGTLQNPDLVSYINQNFVSTSIDVEQFDGVQPSQDNKIKSVPTVIIYNPKGEVIARYEETLTSARLLSELKRINNERTNNQTYHSAMPAHVSKPIQTTFNNAEATVSSSEVENTKMAKRGLAFKPMPGYGLQMSCYEVRKSAAADFISAASRFTKENMILFASKYKTADRYYVIFGPFVSYAQAAAKKEELRRNGLATFVKDLSVMPASITR